MADKQSFLFGSGDQLPPHCVSGRKLAQHDREVKPLPPLARRDEPSQPVEPPPVAPPIAIEPPSEPAPTQGEVIAEKKRLSAQSRQILALLQQRRVRNSELQEIAFNYTARISELRGKGHKIRCVDRDRKTGLSWYELLPPATEESPANTEESSESVA